MVRLDDLPSGMRGHLENAPCPGFNTAPWVTGPPLTRRRVAVISTAGLHTRDDRPFTRDAGDLYRIIPGDVRADDLVMSHVSVNFDRSGFLQDWNVVFPIDRIRELVADGEIGSMADYHYSFMGADDPMRWEVPARRLAGLLKQDGVDAAMLIPV